MKNFEQIDYDETTNQFYIAVKKLDGKETDRKELSSWGFTKTAKACLIVKRLLPSLGTLETETIAELYRVDLLYTVAANSRDYYLKTEQFELENGSKICKIYIKNLNNSTCQQVPTPNKLYQNEFEDLTISKTKGKLIDTKEAVAILKSGECLGIYSEDLTKKFV